MLPEWLPSTVRAFKNSNNAVGILGIYFEFNTNVLGVSRILPEYFPIGYKMLPNLAFSLVNSCAVWTHWTTLRCSRLLFSSRICLIESAGGQEKKKKKTQKISDPSMAGRRQEKAVWTLRKTDGAMKYNNEIMLLATMTIWEAGGWPVVSASDCGCAGASSTT